MPKLTDQEYAGMVRAMMADGETLESAQARANAFENDEPELGQESPAEPAGPSEGMLASGRKDITAGGKTVSEALFNKGAKDATWQQNLLSGATKGVTSTALGVGKLVNKGESALLLPVERLFGVDTTARQAELDRQNQAVEDLFASEKLSGETTAESVGKGIEQAAEFITPLGAAGKAAKATEIAAAAAKAAPKSVRFAKGIGEFLSGTARATPLASAQAGGNEGEGLVNAAGGQVFQQGIGLLGEKVLKPLAGKLWEKLVPLTPGKSAAVESKGLDIGEAVGQVPGMLGIKGLFGSREGLKDAVQSSVTKLGGEVSRVIDDYAAANPGKTFSTKELVQRVESEILDPKNEKRLMADLAITKKDLVSSLDEIGNNLAREAEAYGAELTPQALQGLKRDLQTVVGKAYDKTALEIPLKSTDLVATKALASEARRVIEEAIPATNPINKRLQPLLEALDVLKKKGAYSGVLTDAIAGSTAAGATLYNTGDPLQAIKAALYGIIAKRAGMSTLARSTAAKALSELDKLAQKVPGQAVVAGTKGDAGKPSPLETTIENYLNPAR